MSHATDTLALNILDSTSLLTSLGAFGVFLIVFAETGLLVGFFLPGDSLLFTAGILCTTKATNTVHLSLPTVLCCAGIGSVLGAQVGYYLGRSGGNALLRKSTRPQFHAAVTRAREYLDKYGEAKAIVLARFVPVVRTVLNPVAGVLKVPVTTFTLWQIIGGLTWSMGVTTAGYLLGSRIPNIDKYLLPIIAVIILVSLVPIALELRRSRVEGHQ